MENFCVEWENVVYQLSVEPDIAERIYNDGDFATAFMQSTFGSESLTQVDCKSIGDTDQGDKQNPEDNGYRWSDEATMLLISSYKENEERMVSGKYSKKKCGL